MSKRLIVKVALAITALTATVLLQGCGEDGYIVIGGAWAPIGSEPIMEVGIGVPPNLGSGGGGGQSSTGTTGGAVATASGG